MCPYYQCQYWRCVFHGRLFTPSGPRVQIDVRAAGICTLQQPTGKWRGEGRSRGLRSPDLVFCCILEDHFLVNIFLRFKEETIPSSTASKTETKQSVNSFTFKDDPHPKCTLGPKGHIHERR